MFYPGWVQHSGSPSSGIADFKPNREGAVGFQRLLMLGKNKELPVCEASCTPGQVSHSDL